jgi:transposase
MVRSRPNEPMSIWANAIAARRGKRTAIVALARKLATVMWAVWKNGTNYDPNKAARGTVAQETMS